ncbi:MAG: hypothetical protein ACYC27_08980 [Armatimonadota bacterium]
MEKQSHSDDKRTDDRPAPDRIRGICPECGEPLVSVCYYAQGKGYLIIWECTGAQKDEPSCSYRRVL